MKLKVVRTSLSGPQYGVLYVEGKPFCVTLEREWNDNKQFVSCIPDGEYRCSQRESAVAAFPGYPKGWTIEVHDVPNRGPGILFHPGNFVFNSKGCILVGRSFGDIKRGDEYLRGVKESRPVFLELMTLVKGISDLELEVSSLNNLCSLNVKM